jgi:hypothetical protein
VECSLHKAPEIDSRAAGTTRVEQCRALARYLPVGDWVTGDKSPGGGQIAYVRERRPRSAKDK